MPEVSRAARLARIGSWLALVIGVVAIIVVGLAGPLYRHDAASLGTAFGMMAKGAWIGVAAFVIGVAALVATLVTRRFIAAIAALVGLAFGVVAFGGPWLFQRQARAVPPIHDITTRPGDPPRFIALAAERRKAPNGLAYGGGDEKLAKAETRALQRFFDSPAGRAQPGRDAAMAACRSWGPKCLAAVQHTWYPDIRPLQAQGVAPDRAFGAALASARAMGWRIAAADPATRHIEATATTRWFGFKDDVAIDVTAAGDGSVVNVRSMSRLGLSDVGTNARRVRTYLARLERRLHGN